MADQTPHALLGDFKNFTSNSIAHAINTNPLESITEFLQEKIKSATEKSSKVKHNQF
jgi:hypothetical protein